MKWAADDRLLIIQSAIQDLELTEESIDKYYQMEKIIGAGKYGVVKTGFWKGNNCPWLSNTSLG